MGCFDALILRVLAGSGYKLAWGVSDKTTLTAGVTVSDREAVSGAAVQQAPAGNIFAAGKGDEVEYVMRCECSSPASPEKLRDAVLKINK